MPIQLLQFSLGKIDDDPYSLLDDELTFSSSSIGSVHLVLSSLPPKILKVISAFGWHADRNLGFALLKLCLESKTIRSPLASMMYVSST